MMGETERRRGTTSPDHCSLDSRGVISHLIYLSEKSARWLPCINGKPHACLSGKINRCPHGGLPLWFVAAAASSAYVLG